MFWIRFSVIAHLLQAPITDSSENVPKSNFPLIGGNIIIFSPFSPFKCSYLKKCTLLNLLSVNIWNHGKNLQYFRVQNHGKNVGHV